jgi:hypothetical protein
MPADQPIATSNPGSQSWLAPRDPGSTADLLTEVAASLAFARRKHEGAPNQADDTQV